MWERTKIMLALVLLLLCAYADAVAPGDEIERCRTGTFYIRYTDGVKVLMDSRSYEQLLGVTGEVWDETDFDEHNIQSFSIQTNWKHSVGGVCRWSVQSCGYTEGTQNNWLFTQYILKDAPPNTNYNVSIGVEITYRISNCRPRNRCNPEIEVYNFITTSQQSREKYMNRDLYNRIYYNRVSRPALVTENIYFNVTEGETGFYIAVRDPNSCILISKMLVTRFQCPAKQEDLVLYPETAAPVNNDMTVLTECVPNASPVTELEVTCDSTGNWAGVPTCKCDTGYKKRFDSKKRRYFCEACPAGFYRSGRDPQNVCKACPKNTDLDVVAASECRCLTGYFRNTEGLTDMCPANQVFEGPMSKCTKPPSKPTNLRNTSNTVNSISIAWSSPDFLGERDDLYYTVEYSDPDKVGKMIMAIECMTSTSFTVTGLQPATDYVIRVMARNGVSDQDVGGGLSRMNEIFCRTELARPDPPQDVQIHGSLALWSPSDENTQAFNIMICVKFRPPQSNPRCNTIRLDQTLNYYLISENDIPTAVGAVSLSIKVQAINRVGAGPWSDVLESPLHVPGQDCATCPPPITPEPPSCPTPPPPTSTTQRPTTASTTSPLVTAPGVVTTIRTVSCGVITWKPPQDIGGEMPGYAIRFYDGDTYDTSNYREIQRTFNDPGWHFAEAQNLPNTRPIYADIRAKNSAGASAYSVKVVVANDELCPPETSCSPPTVCPTCNCPVTTCPAPPTCPPRLTCPTRDPCPTCSPPRICPPIPTCPTRGPCPTCPAPETCPTPPSQTPPTECPTAPPCPTCPTGVTSPGVVSNPGMIEVADVVVMECGVMGWMPPPVTGGEIPGYVIRFFDGEDYTRSNYREIQRFKEDPDRRFATAENLPADCSRIIYADIRSINSGGNSPFTAKFIVGNAELCCRREPVSQSVPAPPTRCDSCCPEVDCPECTCPPRPTCPPPTICPTCAPPTICPTCPPPRICPPRVTCPTPRICTTCAPPTTCPPARPCPTCSATPTNTPTNTQISKPGTVPNVYALNCATIVCTIVWDPPVDDGGEIIEYRVRLYAGNNFGDALSSQKTVLSTTDTWVIPAENMPSRRPVYAMVKAKNSAGFSLQWSTIVTVADADN